MATRFAGSPSILNFLASSPNFGKLASTGEMENYKNEVQNLRSNAEIHSAGITGQANVKKAKYAGEATVAQGQAAGHSAMMGGIASGIGSIASGFGAMGGNSYGGYGSGTIDTASVNADIARINNREMGLYSGFPTTSGIG